MDLHERIMEAAKDAITALELNEVEYDRQSPRLRTRLTLENRASISGDERGEPEPPLPGPIGLRGWRKYPWKRSLTMS
jgi:hypothetical protein